jgi:hypothetical protein
MATSLFVSWQDPSNRRWYPIGKLSKADGLYSFAYTKGVLSAKESSNFNGLQSFPDLYHLYKSHNLFPVFRNRLLSPNRPDYQQFIEWLNLPEAVQEPITILARTGGQRETDTLELFPCPEHDNASIYEIYFFVHGIRYQPEAESNIRQLKYGDRLILTPEPENPYDALALRVNNAEVPLGYCPRYLSNDFHKLLRNNQNDCLIQVERVNPEPVPIQFRLLCKFQTAWPQNFKAFDGADYSLITETDEVTIAQSVVKVL